MKLGESVLIVLSVILLINVMLYVGYSCRSNFENQTNAMLTNANINKNQFDKSSKDKSSDLKSNKKSTQLDSDLLNKDSKISNLWHKHERENQKEWKKNIQESELSTLPLHAAQRPEKKKYESGIIDSVIQNFSSRMKDPFLAW